MAKQKYVTYYGNVPERLTFRQKLEYPFMWYEMYINVKLTDVNRYMLTELAFKDLRRFKDEEM